MKNYIPKPDRLSPEAIQTLESYKEWCMMNQKVDQKSFKKLADKFRGGLK